MPFKTINGYKVWITPYQSEIMSEERRNLMKYASAYADSINKLTDSIYLLKRKSLKERKKKQLEEYRKKYDEVEKKLDDYGY